MSRQNIQMLFSLLFFFFASFLFLSIICSSLINNFDSLLIILFRPDGLFASLTMIMLIVSFIISIYLLTLKDNNKKYERFIFLGASIFAFLIISNILSSSKIEQNMPIDIFSQHYYGLINEIKALISDSIIFICFILMPSLNFLYKEKVYKNYFYKTYLKDIAPSLNVSIICLFGYAIQIYDSNYYIVEIILISSFTLIFIRIAMTSKDVITLNLIINLLILITGFIIFLLSKQLLSQIKLHQASMFFYSIALLFWYLNISLKLKENY